MLMYDDSFVAAMTATTDEATALGARIYGSEHVLLGLLVAHDHVTQHVVDMFPGLTAPAVREAVRAALDDAPHLARLGLTLPAASATAPSDGAARGTRPRAKHTPELQSALNQATARWAHLRRSGALHKERKVSSAVLWLAVLEPSARGRRLVDAMQIDPDGVRTAVLSAIVPTGAAIPTWPTEAPVGPATRFTHWVFGHLNLPR